MPSPPDHEARRRRRAEHGRMGQVLTHRPNHRNSLRTMITLDKDQLAAMARVNEGRNVFLTGAAGTGKSSVTVEMIRRRLGDRSLKVCATTGVAALNLRDKLAALFGQDVETSTV